jgi:hypothetical protein
VTSRLSGKGVLYLIAIPCLHLVHEPYSLRGVAILGSVATAAATLSFFPIATRCAWRKDCFGVLRMASTGFLLSSSPAKQFSTFDMSSSPPALTDIIRKKANTLNNDIPAPLIPVNDFATLTSVVSLLDETTSRGLYDPATIPEAICGVEGDISGSGGQQKTTSVRPRKTAIRKARVPSDKVTKPSKKAPVKAKCDAKGDTGEENVTTKKPRKPRAKKVLEGLDLDGTEKAAVPRKPRAKKLEKDGAGDGASVEKAPTKSRGKKTKDDTQTKLSNGQVTKPSVKKMTLDEKLKAAVKLNLSAESTGFGLTNAVQRRSNWTPPPPPLAGQAFTITPLAVDDISGCLASGGSDVSTKGRNGFGDLLESFGFAPTRETAVEKTPQTMEATRKRKLIELVKTNKPTPGTMPPIKEKVPKKKARTITDQATSAYIQVGEAMIGVPPKPTPLLQYFDLQAAENPSNDGFKVPSKSRSKSPTKGQKAKKGTAQAPILLSPESALKQAHNQDYVFGTSSQLAREDSPTLLRDLHEAMQASNAADNYDAFADQILDRGPGRSSKTALSTKRNLWSAAARDPVGDLIEVDILDLANSSPTVGKATNSTVLAAIPLSDPIEQGWHDIEDTIKTLPTKIHTSDARKVVTVEKTTQPQLPINPSSLPTNKNSPVKLRVAKDPEPAKSVSVVSEPQSAPSKAAVPEMPDFSSYPTARLEKEIASYRFKPIKGRPQMIALLERCWEGKQRIALEALQSNVAMATVAPSKPPPSSQVVALSPKRPRGRPRKDATQPSPSNVKGVPRAKVSSKAKALDADSDKSPSSIKPPKKAAKKAPKLVEEIDDSDNPSTPSPSRRPSSPALTDALLLQRSTGGRGVVSEESSQVLLFSHISRAVRNAPRSKDSRTPSWHEKILLYDPIILEDLTVWLNTCGLGMVGWDGEVRPKDVKKWCESKSICCTGRRNLRGEESDCS